MPASNPSRKTSVADLFPKFNPNLQEAPPFENKGNQRTVQRPEFADMLGRFA